MNTVILSGRVGKTPEERPTKSGQNVVTFSIALDRKEKSGDKVTDWFSCTAFGKTAEFIKTYVRQGSGLEVCGSLQTRSWTTENGEKKSITFIMVEKVSFPVSSPKKEESGEVPFEV